jgi:uncharacterized membrane protein YwzB
MRALIPIVVVVALLAFAFWAMDRAERAAGMEKLP